MIALDLFAGGGGMACALRSLGVEARHVELDADACDTLTAAGFGDVVRADVRDPSWYPRGRVDLLHGSPPCPIWSRANRDEAQRALDLGLFINGLPVATFELKNSLTKQTVQDAVEQENRG